MPRLSERIASLPGWSREHDARRALTILHHTCGASLVIDDLCEADLPALAGDAAFDAVRNADLTGAEGVRLDLQLTRLPTGYRAEIVGTPGVPWSAPC